MSTLKIPVEDDWRDFGDRPRADSEIFEQVTIGVDDRLLPEIMDIESEYQANMISLRAFLVPPERYLGFVEYAKRQSRSGMYAGLDDQINHSPQGMRIRGRHGEYDLMSGPTKKIIPIIMEGQEMRIIQKKKTIERIDMRTDPKTFDDLLEEANETSK